MCILFLYVDNNPQPGTYQVIIAVNRDEYFKRPTAPAHFWNDLCISGLDMEPGREGGTWFGTSKSSKTGALLNILQTDPCLDKLGRGHLVTNFLTGTEDATSYIASVSADRHSYRAFNLVLLEKKDGKWLVHYCSTEDEATPCQLPTGVLVFGNSAYDRPWQKVVRGKTEFEKIISSLNSVSKKTDLKGSLISMLKNREANLPDPQLELQLNHKVNFLSTRSAVFVQSLPQFPYGTRTHSILLIDDAGHCEFTESTISDFSDVINPIWETVTHVYDLNVAK